MTQGPQGGEPRELAPTRRTSRGAGRAAEPGSAPYTEAEVAQGQAAAVLGALGRMQLQLDVLNRQHADALAQIAARLDELTARLSPADPPPSAAYEL